MAGECLSQDEKRTIISTDYMRSLLTSNQTQRMNRHAQQSLNLAGTPAMAGVRELNISSAINLNRITSANKQLPLILSASDSNFDLAEKYKQYKAT